MKRPEERNLEERSWDSSINSVAASGLKCKTITIHSIRKFLKF